MTDQSDAGSVGIFSWPTNATKKSYYLWRKRTAGSDLPPKSRLTSATSGRIPKKVEAAMKKANMSMDLL
eukprot:418096-Prorocentrum_minimum.AAC.2